MVFIIIIMWNLGNGTNGNLFCYNNIILQVELLELLCWRDISNNKLVFRLKTAPPIIVGTWPMSVLQWQHIRVLIVHCCHCHSIHRGIL